MACRAGLHVLGKRRICCLCWEVIQNISVYPSSSLVTIMTELCIYVEIQAGLSSICGRVVAVSGSGAEDSVPLCS
jgi:hypothetical protein